MTHVFAQLAAPVPRASPKRTKTKVEEVPSIEGYLDKQKKKGAKNWQKRWFKLDGPQVIFACMDRRNISGLRKRNISVVRDSVVCRPSSSTPSHTKIRVTKH